MSASKPSFATFWAGEGFPAYEAACLSSFVRHGYEMAVYSFDEISNLPPGVELRPAGEIVEQRFVHAFLIKGKPSLSHFSDLFRYRLFQKTQATWVDSDMYLLRPFDIELPTTLLAREDAQALCGAIMRLDQANPALGQLVDKTEAVAGRNLVWGQTGPRLLTSVFGADVMARSYGPEQFFPIHYDEFWKVFLPEYQAECAALCEKAYTLHLWNNIVTKVGVCRPRDPISSVCSSRTGCSTCSRAPSLPAPCIMSSTTTACGSAAISMMSPSWRSLHCLGSSGALSDRSSVCGTG
jgi:hypothetical protein